MRCFTDVCNNIRTVNQNTVYQYRQFECKQDFKTKPHLFTKLAVGLGPVTFKILSDQTSLHFHQF